MSNPWNWFELIAVRRKYFSSYKLIQLEICKKNQIAKTLERNFQTRAQLKEEYSRIGSKNVTVNGFKIDQ